MNVTIKASERTLGLLTRSSATEWNIPHVARPNQSGAKNVGHRVGRSTIARILKAQGIPPVPERPTSWQTFLRAHWGVIAGADFFTTEVWTWRGLVTYYTVFVIDLASRRVQIVGSAPSPNDLFMRQVGRTLLRSRGVMTRDRRFRCLGSLVRHYAIPSCSSRCP